MKECLTSYHSPPHIGGRRVVSEASSEALAEKRRHYVSVAMWEALADRERSEHDRGASEASDEHLVLRGAAMSPRGTVVHDMVPDGEFMPYHAKYRSEFCPSEFCPFSALWPPPTDEKEGRYTVE